MPIISHTLYCVSKYGFQRVCAAFFNGLKRYCFTFLLGESSLLLILAVIWLIPSVIVGLINCWNIRQYSARSIL